MQKATKGAILKHRIREMGYTQEEFSEVTGVAYSTLKKYLADKCPYDVDLLELFAEKLECSYDYLMGYSISPERELQSVKDATRLSDAAIRNLQKYAKEYDKFEYDRYTTDALSVLLEDEPFIDAVTQYVKPKKEMVEYYEMVKEAYKQQYEYELKIPLETANMMTIVNELSRIVHK